MDTHSRIQAFINYIDNLKPYLKGSPNIYTDFTDDYLLVRILYVDTSKIDFIISKEEIEVFSCEWFFAMIGSEVSEELHRRGYTTLTGSQNG